MHKSIITCIVVSPYVNEYCIAVSCSTVAVIRLLSDINQI